MHLTAILFGLLVNFWGDVGLLFVGVLIWTGPDIYMADEWFPYRSRFAVGFELLPIPIGVAGSGVLLARWGFAGF